MINKKNKNTWCVNAFHAMSGNNTGSTKLCCMYLNEDPEFQLGKKSIIENYNQPTFQKVRKDLMAGVKNNLCSRCFDEEAAGRKSKRARDNEKYFNELENGAEPYNGLAKVELNLGNTCNLKCRTCAPHSSSAWMQEYYDIYENKKYSTFKIYAQDMKKYHQHYDEESPFWDDLEQNLHTIKQFDFYGGEPFMSKKMWKILEIAVEKGYSKDIELHYNTNGTHFPIKEMQSWKHYKKVFISFSIDGIQDKFEYMRYPAVWNEVEENMKKFYEIGLEFGNISFNWCVTLSSINIYSLPETLEYFYKNFKEKGFSLYLNLVHAPSYYNITMLPDDIKNAVTKKLNSIPKNMDEAWNYIPGIINFMNQVTGKTEDLNKFINSIKASDQYRNQNFRKVFNDYGCFYDSYFI